MTAVSVTAAFTAYAANRRVAAQDVTHDAATLIQTLASNTAPAATSPQRCMLLSLPLEIHWLESQ